MKKYPLIAMAFFMPNVSYADAAIKSDLSDAAKQFFSEVNGKLTSKDIENDKKNPEEKAQDIGDTRSSSPTSLVSAFEINADTDASSANIKITPATSKYNFSLLLSTPLNKDKKEGKFYDTNAFAKGSYAQISTQYVFFHKKDSERDTELKNVERLIDFCKEHPDYFDYKQASDCSGIQSIDNLIEKYQSKKLGLNPIVDYWVEQINRPKILLSSSLKAGREDFDYLSGMDKQSTSRTPWGGGVNLTYLKPEKFMLSAGYEYQKGYDAQKTGVVCPVASSGSFVNCVQGAKGAPKENINHIVSLEYRQKLPWEKMPLAIAPKVQRDLEDDVTDVSIPVYFFQNEKGGLTGGVSTDWNSKDKDWKFGVFIGSTFDLDLK